MKYFIKTVLAFVLISVATLTFAQTPISSIISTDETWDAKGSPYQLTQNALIKQGVTVTVLPGTIIESQNTAFKLIIDGQFIAKGKKDSVIEITHMGFDFTDKSVDYDPTTKTGSQFQYCHFEGSGSGGSRTIALKETGMLVSNCKFINGYYNIYSIGSQDSVDIIIEKSVFMGKSTNYGYPIYMSGSYSTRLFFNDCYVENMYNMYVGRYLSMTGNTFNKINGSSGIRTTTNFTHLHMECNLFKNFKYGILDLSYPAAGAVISVTYNTFDSSAYFIKQYVYNFKPSVFDVKHNNFLNYKTNSVQIYGGTSPGSADTFSYERNYWGTTNASVIGHGILDFNDDITRAGLVNYSNYLAHDVQTCSNGDTIGSADTSGSNVGISVLSIDDFDIYPNPVKNILKIHSRHSAIESVRVFDLKGSVVLEIANQDHHVELNLTNFENDIYLLEINTSQGVLRKRVVKLN